MLKVSATCHCCHHQIGIASLLASHHFFLTLQYILCIFPLLTLMMTIWEDLIWMALLNLMVPKPFTRGAPLRNSDHFLMCLKSSLPLSLSWWSILGIYYIHLISWMDGCFRWALMKWTRKPIISSITFISFVEYLFVRMECNLSVCVSEFELLMVFGKGWCVVLLCCALS